MRKLFTSESVTEGHPDKLCDLISDSVLDAFIKEDPYSRVACETLAGKGEIIISGEITSNANVDIEKLVRETIKNVGFDDAKTDLDYKTCKVHINMSKQSADIALGVDKSYESKISEKAEESEGAGDQGLMFGYACDETEELMPLPILLAHKLAKRLTYVRKENILPYLRPDGKTQVTVEYEDDKPKRIETILISTQHLDTDSLEEIRKGIIKEVINKVVPQDMMDEKTNIYVNPTGRFVIGGPLGDTGLTGRKIIVDTYGGYAKHGGGCFSGKDASKVDRSAAYMLRHIAKNLVANGYAKKCEIQVSYAIGVSKPVSLFINTYNTNKIEEDKILDIIDKVFDFTPSNIIKELDLRKPIYHLTTCFGHMGKENLPWERLNKVESILKLK